MVLSDSTIHQSCEIWDKHVKFQPLLNRQLELLHHDSRQMNIFSAIIQVFLIKTFKLLIWPSNDHDSCSSNVILHAKWFFIIINN